MNKKITAAVLAASLTLASVMPTIAAVTREDKSASGITYIYTNNGMDIKYPCWIWVDGYCYYYQNAGTILKNTTTPDGYTVDVEGRWVNGTVQTNGYGSYVMGTSDYAGKSNDEIWSLMKNKLTPVYSTAISFSDITYSIAADEIAFDIGTGAIFGNDITVSHNNSVHGTFITVGIGNAWSDQRYSISEAVDKTRYAKESEIKEKTIKTVIGDQIGQELFNYIRPHADKTYAGYIDELDANGNRIYGWWTIDPSTISESLPFGDPNAPDVWINDPNGDQWKRVWSETCGNGIDASTLDLSAWQNRTTDYGKRFSVDNSNGRIDIHIYN